METSIEPLQMLTYVQKPYEKIYTHFSAYGIAWDNFWRDGQKTAPKQFNSMIFAELSYSPLKLFEKAAIGGSNFLYNSIRTHNFAASNKMESQAIS